MEEFIKINDIVSYRKEKCIVSSYFDNIMSITIDKTLKKPFYGVVRLIVSRRLLSNNEGYLDKSKLAIVKSYDLLNWQYYKDLEIFGINEVLRKIESENKYFIGLEDPDIWIDSEGLIHLYFTIAFKYKNKVGYETYLGHGFGKSLENLKAGVPLLSPIKNLVTGFKEICINPIDLDEKINLCEVLINDKGKRSSVIGSCLAEKIDKNWEYLGISLDSRKAKYDWYSKECSPCCFFSKDFIDRGKYLVGIINGRNKKIKNEREKFNPGLILFEPISGKIVWVSEEPLFVDCEAESIVFASDFVYHLNQGLLFCHIDDSFIRVYKIDKNELEKKVPKL